MNIRKGDIVQLKDMPFIQGKVVSFYFYRPLGKHTVAFHSGGGYLKYKEPWLLRVVRRKPG